MNESKSQTPSSAHAYDDAVFYATPQGDVTSDVMSVVSATKAIAMSVMAAIAIRSEQAAPRRMRTHRRHGVLALLLVGLAIGLVGCKQPAMYELQLRPTVVLVDDPQEYMGLTGQSEAVAWRIDRDLRERVKDIEPLMIDQSEMTALRHKLGKDFASTPIDKIGQALGAQQVIHVAVLDAQARAGAGTIQPSATGEVKIIDVVERKRLFPASVTAETPGQMVEVEMPMRAITIENANAAEVQGMQLIAQKLGREVARLFYEFDPGDPREFDRSLGDLNRTGPKPMPR